MLAYFYEKEVDVHVFQQPVHKKLQIWFHLEKDSIADRPDKAVPFEFDGPAEDRHFIDYKKEYYKFLKDQLDGSVSPHKQVEREMINSVEVPVKVIEAVNKDLDEAFKEEAIENV